MMRIALAGCVIMAAAACATLSPRGKIEQRFVEFGVSKERAKCLASELDERLDRSDLESVADYIGGLNEATTAGGALDALLRIDNPRAAAEIARAGVACALDSL